MSITIILIFITVITSILAWKKAYLFDKLRFNASHVVYGKEYHRLFTYAFLHGDWGHLFINMFVLWMFGNLVEETYAQWWEMKGTVLFLFLYLTAIVISTLSDVKKHKENYNYNAVGASGAVSAILFASILIYPMQKIYIFFIPIGVPAFIFGILYLLYSTYMSKKQIDNIGHNAHFWGGVYGFFFTLLFKKSLIVSFFVQILQIFN
ncbi:MAG: rhomboid family intramembrane serine protease [Lentimicrobiaceae bacterium]|nr:rhomboid family intramembrane serine protease [Lentimicrobiaceae bacterium]